MDPYRTFEVFDLQSIMADEESLPRYIDKIRLVCMNTDGPAGVSAPDASPHDALFMTQERRDMLELQQEFVSCPHGVDLDPFNIAIVLARNNPTHSLDGVVHFYVAPFVIAHTEHLTCYGLRIWVLHRRDI